MSTAVYACMVAEGSALPLVGLIALLGATILLGFLSKRSEREVPMRKNKMLERLIDLKKSVVETSWAIGAHLAAVSLPC